MTRLNWTATNNRRRIRVQGAETVNGVAFGGNAPAAQPEPPLAGRRPLLAASVEIAKFWKSRRRDIAVVVALGPYKEHNLISVREHVVGSDGIMRPSTRGVSLVVRWLPELATALATALRKARELGLLEVDGAGE